MEARLHYFPLRGGSPPTKRLQGAPDGAGQAPTTGTDSLTPLFRAVSGQPRPGPCALLANRVVPLSANQPIAARPRRKFERQLLASRSARSIAAPNSNQRSPTLALRARGAGPGRREPGTRRVIAQEKGRRSSSGSGPRPASLGLRHGRQQWRRVGGGGSESECVLLEISRILNTGLDMETLSICVRLCEQGINPEALSSVIKELRKATEALKAAENMTS
ncbi:mitotic-spindle organizing protein 1 [Moschus berezovskii]|nr:mitotic-spindle organizing protein 1 [Moschus berezovskii]